MQTSPESPGRREQNKREKRARIVEAATELFTEHGFEATTGRQICERAGIATGTLFLYVRDKRELLFLIFEPLAAAAFRRLPVGLRPDEDVADGLMNLFGAFLRLYGRHVEISRLFVQELLFRPDRPEEMKPLALELQRRVAQIVADGLARGALRSDCAPHEIASAFSAHYVLWTQLWLGTGVVGRRAAERGLRNSLELQLAGVAASAHPRKA